LRDYIGRDRFFQIAGLTLLILIMVTTVGGYSGSLYEFDTLNNKSGALLFAFSLVFRIWAHVVIDTSYSPTLEVRAGHRLVKKGPYKYIRHPIILEQLSRS
jgi:protein-S-isoprenylcysteine O-methyltransferase Ste14